MGMTVHNRSLYAPGSLTLALAFGPHRVYLVGRREAPLWRRRRGPFERNLTVVWHRVEHAAGHWWTAQVGRDLVVLGQGARPALVIEKNGSRWQALIPSGYQSTRVQLPDGGRVAVRPVMTATRDHRSISRAD